MRISIVLFFSVFLLNYAYSMETLVGVKDSTNPNLISESDKHIGFGIFKVKSTEIAEFIANHRDNVEFVETDSKVSIAQLNDPEFRGQWALKNRGQRSGKKDFDIDIERLWKGNGNRSYNPVVAVLDTGFDFKDQDLKKKVWKNKAEINGKSGVDDDGNGYIDDKFGYNVINPKKRPNDNHGHGGFISHVIAAEGNNKHGIAGVNWDAQVLPIKVLDKSGGGNISDIIVGINYAIKNKADVINMSWGTYKRSRALQQAISSSSNLKTIFIAAAGNDSKNIRSYPFYPASYNYSNLIAVAATNNKGELSRFSNYGNYNVELAAPGEDIVSNLRGQYEYLSGTSYSAAYVSGVASLVLNETGKVSGAKLKKQILRSSRHEALLKNKVRGGKVLNAYYTVKNEVHPGDPQKPRTWQSETKSISSNHYPYQRGVQLRWKVKVPGAKKIALYFYKIDIDSATDKLVIRDKDLNDVEVLNGYGSRFYSKIIDGDTAEIEFTTDANSRRRLYGFKIDKVAYYK